MLVITSQYNFVNKCGINKNYIYFYTKFIYTDTMRNNEC